MDLHTLRELLIFFACRLHDWCAHVARNAPDQNHSPQHHQKTALLSRHTQAAAMRGALALCGTPRDSPPAVQLPAEASCPLVASLAEHVHMQDLKEHEQQTCLDLLSSLVKVRVQDQGMLPRHTVDCEPLRHPVSCRRMAALQPGGWMQPSC